MVNHWFLRVDAYERDVYDLNQMAEVYHPGLLRTMNLYSIEIVYLFDMFGFMR